MGRGQAAPPLFAIRAIGYAPNMASMDRASSKHSPRVDDQMAEESQGYTQGSGAGSRSEEWHESEPPGDDQPDASLIPDAVEEDDDEGLSRLGRYIPRNVLPGTREGLLAGAARLNAPDDVLDLLQRLDPQREFATVSEVWAALGHHLDRQHR